MRSLFPVSLVLVLSIAPVTAATLPDTASAATNTGTVAAMGTHPAPTASTPPPDVPEGWLSQVQQDIAAREYHLSWKDRPVRAGLPPAWQAPNRAHGFRSYFTPQGLHVVPRMESEPSWELKLSLSGYGRGDQLWPLPAAEISPTENRIDFSRGGIEEWYVNSPAGLKQGFLLPAPPEEVATWSSALPRATGPQPPGSSRDGSPEGLVYLELALRGDLSPIISADNQAIEFTTPAGARVARYAELQVTDAGGREVPAWMEGFSGNGERGIRLVMDASEVVYPLTIDPLLTSPAWTAESNQAGAFYGLAVGTAGDVNGDGYSDVIVGAYLYDTGTTRVGQVYLYLGSASGLESAPDWTAQGVQTNEELGRSIGTAGDVNGDGYADVIVGALRYDTEDGRASVYLGSPSGLGATPDWTVLSDQADVYLGHVGTAGDVNGDGYTDVIVGATHYDNGEVDEGMAFVFHGSASGLAGAPDATPLDAAWRVESDQADMHLGNSVGTAGDVNGDGYADVIIGAAGYDNGQTNEGGAFVFHGSASGLAGAPNATLLDAAWAAEGDQADASFGSLVSTAGDVNGDGYADVVVGAPYYDNGLTDEGMAFVYHGSASGLSTSPAWTAESNNSGSQFGIAVATAGDVNGDGYADIVVGARKYDGGMIEQGAAFSYLGSATGLETTPSWTVLGDKTWIRYGSAVGTAGDVNGDGYSDVIVGAYLYDNGQTDEGKAFAYHGSPAGLAATAGWTAEGDQMGVRFSYSVASAGDVNGDGYADVIVGAIQYNYGMALVYHGSASGLEASPAWTADGGQPACYFGYSVSTAGDVNGDGYADVIVGARGYDNGQTDEGKAFVYHGSATSLAASPAWTAESDQASAYFGISVATAGDVNGDGYADVIVGALRYDNGETDEGKAFVYHGSATGLAAGPAWTAESDQAGADFGHSVSTAGDVNGDGYADVIVGANLYNNGVGDEGMAFVYHGSPTGLAATAAWTTESDQFGAQLGKPVATAGDVNGDGYADVIVGAHRYDNGETDEGMALVYLGSATGLAAIADWTAESDQADAWFGYSVATAGDINGDGYADIIVGAHLYDNGQNNEGEALVYTGSALGLAASPDWTAESDQASAWFGYSAAAAGDVNGDGYADVIVGAPECDNGETDEGMAFVYYGNDGNGLALTPQQRRFDDAAPIATAGWSDSRDSFRLSAVGRTPFGRNSVKLEWEVKPLGTPFDGTGTGQSVAWIDTGTAGAALNETISGLAAAASYHWRARLLYNPASCPYQQASRWFTVPWNGWNETDLNTLHESDLTLTQTDVDPIVTTESLEYTLVVTNGGPDAAGGIVVSNTLPVGAVFVHVSYTMGSCSESGGVVTCSLSMIPYGGAATITIEATAATPGLYTNVASVTSNSRDPNMADNSSTEDTTVLQPRIGGLVWEDRNGDGIQGAAEPRIGGILVELLDNVGTPVNLTLTAGDGSYAFTVPAIDVYQVRFDVPSGWVLTMPDQGVDDSLDSDADVFTGETAIIGSAFTLADFTRWSAGLRRVGPCFAPDEPLFIANVRMVGTATVLDYQDGNQPEQVTGYNVYRSSDAGLAPELWPLMASDVVDMDAATPNIQWVDDTGDVSPTGIWYYDVAAYNSVCDMEGPR